MTQQQYDGIILTTIKSPGPGPSGLSYDGENLWVADRTDRKISKIAPSSGQVLFSIAFDGELAGTAWDGSHVWQADRTSRTISRIDPETGNIDRHITVDLTTGDVTGLFHEPNALWYGLSRLGQARKVRDTDGRFIRAFPTKADIGGIAVVGKSLFYTEPNAGIVHKMDANTGSILISYKVGGKPSALCHDGTAFWMADSQTAEIKRLRF